MYKVIVSFERFHYFQIFFLILYILIPITVSRFTLNDFSFNDSSKTSAGIVFLNNLLYTDS